jgi:G8 domain.
MKHKPAVSPQHGAWERFVGFKLAGICWLLVLIGLGPAFGQIQSTPSGGNWSESSTWIGGRVPDAGDDVVINGPVRLDSDRSCRNLTVNPSGALRNVTHNTLTANSLTNRGTVENGGGGWRLYLHIASSVVHEGATFAPYRLIFTGAGDAQLSGTGTFNMREFDKQVDGRIVAGSALRFGENCNARLKTMCWSWAATSSRFQVPAAFISMAAVLRGVSRMPPFSQPVKLTLLAPSACAYKAAPH